MEWEVIDSAGFSVRPPFFDTANEQPYTSFEGPLVPFKNTRATNKTIIDRVQYYTQWSHRNDINGNELYYNIGVRGHHWSVTDEKSKSKSSQFVFSKRTIRHKTQLE